MKWGTKNEKRQWLSFLTLCLGGTVTVTLVSERKRSEADTQTQNFKGCFNTILSQDLGLP